MSRTTIDIRVQIYESEYRAIVAEARRLPRIETGGDLYGTFTHGSKPVIWLASGPGPNVRHENTHFEQDIAFTTYWEERLMKDFAIQYIGSWHSHHFLGLHEPSSGDVGAAQIYARQHNRQTTLEIIVNHQLNRQRRADEPEFLTELRPYFYPDAQNARRTGPTRVNFVVLQGVSPLRQQLRNDAPYMFGGFNWQQATGFQLPSEQALPASRNETPRISASPPGEVAPQIPTALAAELESISTLNEVEGSTIEPKSKAYMIIISLAAGPIVAVAVEKSLELAILQVNLIDHEREINEDITPLLRMEPRIKLFINRENSGVLRRIIHRIPSIHGRLESAVADDRVQADRHFEAQLNDIKQRLLEQQSAAQRLQDKLVAAQRQVEIEKASVRQLEARLQEAQQSPAQLLEAQRQLLEAQQQLNETRQREAQLSETQRHLQEQLRMTQQRLEEQRSEAQRQIEAERTSVRQLEAQLRTVQQVDVHQQLQAQLTAARQHEAQLLETQQQLDAQLRQAQQQLAQQNQLERELSEAKQRLEQERQIEDQLRQTKQQLQEQLNIAQQGEAQLLQAQQELEQQRQIDTQRQAQIQQQLEAQRSEIEKLETQLRQAQQQLEAGQKSWIRRIVIKIREGPLWVIIATVVLVLIVVTAFTLVFGHTLLSR